MQDTSTILIFTSTDAEPVDGRRTRSGVDDLARRTTDRAVEVSTAALKQSVHRAYRSCLEMIETLPASGSGVLETVTFSLVISGEGQVGLLSTAVKAGTQVGLTFQVRIDPPDNHPAGDTDG
jgi:hypothetical protein